MACLPSNSNSRYLGSGRISSHMNMHFLLNISLERLAGIFQDCMLPIHMPKFLQSGISYNCHATWRVELSDQRWGHIGAIKLIAQPPHQTILHFQEFALPSRNEIAQFEIPLRQRLQAESLSYRLVDFYDSREQIDPILLDALQRYRQDVLIQTETWLLRRLRIYGVHLPNPVGVKDAPDRDLHALLGMEQQIDSAPESTFELLLQGSPAEFGHLVQRFIALRGKPFACRVQIPGSKPGVWSAETVHIEARIFQGKLLIIALVHSLPDGGSLLTVQLENQEEVWQVWDLLREELERLGMLRLPLVESIISPLSREVVADVNLPLWQRIPNHGNRLLILQLWHEGLTAKEIGKRIGRSWKTVDNLLSKWRKEFGEEIAPLRREKEPPAGQE